MKTAKFFNCNSVADIHFMSPNTVRYSFRHDLSGEVHEMKRPDFNKIAYDF